MNKLIIALVALVVFVGGFFILNSYLYQEKPVDENVSTLPERDVYLGQFADRSIELAFAYPDGPDGYAIDDLSDFIGEEPLGIEVVKVYRIMNAKEKFELENSEGGREGPPAMQVMVFKNGQNHSASSWIDAYPAFSNIEMILGEVNRDAVVGGANAVRYKTDGLYVSENAVVVSGDFVYHFIGSYHEPDSIIHQDFKGIIDSVRFIPVVDTGATARNDNDLRVLCEQALTYMLFESGEQADQFLEECLVGEHPAVFTSGTPVISVSAPAANQKVNSPIELAGYAQGNWFFEATAPVVVVDWDGRIIGQSYIEAEGDWMTEEVVPFSGSVEYSLPAEIYSKSGTIIFQKSNPSGLPEHEAAVEVKVNFE